jgi:Domain of unknown function (DUF4307)
VTVDDVAVNDVTAARDRYGSRATGRLRRRWPRWVVAGLVVVAGLTLAVIGYRNLGTKPITAEVMAFTVLDDRSVRITLAVTRDEPDKAADCIVRTRSADGAETGRREVYIPAGDNPVQIDTVLQSVRRPATGEVFGCSYQVPPYLGKQVRPSG